MRNQQCNGCLTPIRQGFSNGTSLFCTQSCEQEYRENDNRPVKRRRLPRS